MKKPSICAEWFSKTFQDYSTLQEKLGKLPDEFSFTYMPVSIDGEKDLVMAPAEFDFKPDSNSLIFVASLLQALNTLGALEECVENLEQRISSELFLIVESEIKKASLILKKSHRNRPENIDKFVLVPGGMNNISRDEFHLFCPILREMTSVVVAKMIVVVNIFKFIDETIKNLKGAKESSSEQFESPLNLAIQAAFRELRNYVTSILYSNASPSEIFSNPISEISEILRNSKTKSTNDKSDLITFSMALDDHYVNEIKSIPIRVSEKDKDLSKKLAAALNIDPYASSKKDQGHKQIVKPNIQYMQVLFNQVVIFNDVIKQICPEDFASNEAIISSFQSIMEKEYIPFIENYMIHELVTSFKSSDSSNWIDFGNTTDSIGFTSSIGKKSDSILCSYLKFVRLICEACRLIYFIPSFQESFENIMEQLCDQLLDKSEVKLRDLILVKFSGEEDSSSNLLCFSVLFAKNPEIRAILSQNGLLHGSPNVQLNHLLSEKEAVVMERLKGDRSIGKNELLFDAKVIRELALLQRSFEQVPKLILKGKFSPHEHQNGSGGMTKIVLDETKSLHLHVYEDGKKTVFKMGAGFDAKFLVFSELLDKLAQTCLFTLHCEMRTHSFYFLDLAFREGSYKLEKLSVNEPDPYVLNWTNDLLLLSDCLSDWFPLSKYLFLFDGLSILVDSILVNNFQYIKSINAEGCEKLCTNTTAIIQILTQILPPTEVALPKATEYYRLAKISRENLIPEIQASPIRFTFSQYRALLDMVYREALRLDNNEAARKDYANHLTMLKYMTTGKEEKRNE